MGLILYMALCSSIDKSFGLLLDKLEEKGIKDETIIVLPPTTAIFLQPIINTAIKVNLRQYPVECHLLFVIRKN